MEHKDDDERMERLQVFLRPVIKSAPICGGYILDAMDWGSMMVVSEPGQNYDAASCLLLSRYLILCQRLLIQYLKYVDKIKLKVLPKSRIRDCFYVLLTATEASRRKQGLLSALIQYLMEEARRVAKPVWLEATSRYSMNQFLRHGFELVEDIKVGEGKVNSQGKKEAGGDGVLIAYANVRYPS
uniref:N-acetyltransferase domain-containing protein n=1 Tax=Fusarium oxysporum (strain Fo5176) TaxID=660025 RepID=A0A0D2YHQ5_FUSOF